MSSEALDLATSGAKLLEDDEKTLNFIADRTKRVRTAHDTQTIDCAAIMADLKRKQEERKKTWWSKIFG